MNPKGAEKRKELVLRLPAELHAAVKERAVLDDRSMAATVRRALKCYLAHPQGEDE